MDSIVKQNSIDWEDVVIIVFEKYQSAFQKADYSKSKLVMQNIDKLFNYGGGLKGVITEWKRHQFAKKLVGKEEFLLYSPVDSLNIHRHLIFLENCKGYYLIEEGLSSYFDFSFMLFEKKSKSWKHLLQPRASQYISQHPINRYDKMLGGIGFHQLAYPYLEKGKVSIIPIHFHGELEVIVESAMPLYVFDGMVDNGQCSVVFLVSYLKEHFKLFAANRIYIKFHPRQSGEERQAIKEMLKSLGQDFEELSDDVVIEYILMNYPIKLFGFYSSLLFYNKLFGSGESFSLGKDFLNSLPEEKREERMKTIFGKVVFDIFDEVQVRYIENRVNEEEIK